MRVPYKEYVIEANPHELADDGRWTVNVVIERHSDEGVEVASFHAANKFATRDEAVQHCLKYGRRVIDGQVPGCGAP